MGIVLSGAGTAILRRSGIVRGPDLKSLDQPFIGITFDVKSHVDYKVTGPKGATPIKVDATGTATPSDAFIGVERLRIANERSVLENVREFINQLAKFAD